MRAERQVFQLVLLYGCHTIFFEEEEKKEKKAKKGGGYFNRSKNHFLFQERKLKLVVARVRALSLAIAIAADILR